MGHRTISVATGLLFVSPVAHGYALIYSGPVNPLRVQDGTGNLVSIGSAMGGAADRVGIASALFTEGYEAFRVTPDGLTQLGNLGFYDVVRSNSYVKAVNASGTVVGQASNTYGDYVAVEWKDSSSTATELGHLNPSGRDQSSAVAINASGVATGYAGSPNGTRAVRWDSDGNVTELLPAAGGAGGSGVAINASGTVVGAGGPGRAARWDAGQVNGTLLDTLGLPTAGITTCDVVAINDAGTSVGRAKKVVNNASLGFRGVRWNAGTSAVTELDNLGTGTGKANSEAYMINASGTTIGTSDKFTNGVFQGTRPVYWDAVGTAVHELGGLSGSGVNQYGVPSSINDAGLIVGAVGNVAVMWDTQGIAVNLNSLIDPSYWQLISATSITQNNWVTGMGYYDPDGTGPQRNYLTSYLMQVPEPGSCFSGLAALTLLGRARRRTFRVASS